MKRSIAVLALLVGAAVPFGAAPTLATGSHAATASSRPAHWKEKVVWHKGDSYGFHFSQPHKGLRLFVSTPDRESGQHLSVENWRRGCSFTSGYSITLDGAKRAYHHRAPFGDNTLPDHKWKVIVIHGLCHR